MKHKCLLGLDNPISKIFHNVYSEIPQSKDAPNLSAFPPRGLLLPGHLETPCSCCQVALSQQNYLAPFPAGQLPALQALDVS